MLTAADRDALWKLLEMHEGNQTAVARVVGCSLATIRKRVREIGFPPNRGGRPKVNFSAALLKTQTVHLPETLKLPETPTPRVLGRPGRKVVTETEIVLYPVSRAFHGMVPGEFPEYSEALVEISQTVLGHAMATMTREALTKTMAEDLAQLSKSMPLGWPTRAKLERTSRGRLHVTVTQWQRRDGSGLVNC